MKPPDGNTRSLLGVALGYSSTKLGRERRTQTEASPRPATSSWGVGAARAVVQAKATRSPVFTWANMEGGRDLTEKKHKNNKANDK